MTAAASSPPVFQGIAADGGLEYYFHDGQARVMESTKRITLALAGSQSGKTVIGPPWMWQEIQARGPGDYLVVTPTYPLLHLKALPEFLRLFETMLKLGKFRGDHVFTFSAGGAKRMWGRVPKEPTRVIFGHASNPESLESATAKAAWLDEAGQNAFKLGSWEAVNRRLTVHQGRILITTTPYSGGWLKQLIYDPWEKAKRNHPYIEVINFKSIANPTFPQEEFERARQSMPLWRFRMFYEGAFERPAGMIYDCFDAEKMVVPPFAILPSWKRYQGVDFGGVNTAAVWLAEEPGTRRLYAYREYHDGNKTAKQHAEAFKKGEPGLPTACFGGAGSEDQWRDEFGAAGFPISEPPIRDVEVGINRVYGMIQRDEFRVFSTLTGLLDELGSYSREVDEAGNPLESIDDPHSYHRADALRYVTTHLRGGKRRLFVGV